MNGVRESGCTYCEVHARGLYKHPNGPRMGAFCAPDQQTSYFTPKMSTEMKQTLASKPADGEAGVGQTSGYADLEADKTYRKKVDFWVLPLLCLVMQFCHSC